MIQRNGSVSWKTAVETAIAEQKKITNQDNLFYFIIKLYNIVLVLPNIEMNPPQVYLCSPS